jgi:hypothetical protein
MAVRTNVSDMRDSAKHSPYIPGQSPGFGDSGHSEVRQSADCVGLFVSDWMILAPCSAGIFASVTVPGCSLRDYAE